MASSLEKFVEDVSGTNHLRIEHNFGDGFVRLQTSEAERRQAAQDIRCTEDIVLELLRNSRDAHANHIFVAMSREGSKRRLTVIDDGCGIPEGMHALIFEPRVTSKLDTSHMDAWGIHGRGMALFSITMNAEKAMVVESSPDMGCSLFVETDLAKLGERKDQSSFPTFEMGNQNKVNVRGPKNVLRTVCEFAIESRNLCSVFMGSPAEIVAALYEYGIATLSTLDRLFPHESAQVPLTKRLAQATDPESLAKAADGLGLSISQRTARRVIDGEIEAPEPILDQIAIKPKKQGKSKNSDKASPAPKRKFKLLDDDMRLLSYSVACSYKEIAARYYLENDVEPTIRARHDRITITIPVVHKD